MHLADEVIESALALPEEGRIELLEAVIASLQPADRPPLDEAWRGIVQRRSAELRSGQVVAVPWEEAKRPG